jgi:hypothetical protein
MKTKPTRYTTSGRVRGCCGHRHLTIAAAHKCVERDQRNCWRQGGHSDRHVAAVDESFPPDPWTGDPYTRPLNDDEWEELGEAENAGSYSNANLT